MGLDDWDEPSPRISFSGTEVLHLVLSVVVLSVAFAFALGSFSVLDATFDWRSVVGILPFSAAIVVTSFVLHELAHKVVAQRRDLWAEYRSSFLGLGLGLAVAALTKIVMAAPGAVHIYGRATDRDSGVISLVGPLVNLGLGFAAYPFAFSATSEPLEVGAAGNLLEIVVFINAFLAVFNMIPIHPLDGSKIWRWNKGMYFATLALCGFLLWLFFSAGGLGF